MPRSSSLLLVTALTFTFGACTFAPPTAGGAGASSGGGPLGSAASSGTGTGLIGGGGAQTGQGNINGMNCAQVNQQVAKLPPDILIIQDKSGSMNDDPATGMTCNTAGCTKWDQTTAALTQVVTATDGTVNWGIKFFASPGGGACTVNNGVEVPIAANNSGAVNNAIAGQAPSGSTPTRLAMNAGAAYMATLTDQNPKFILLATDGIPNCIPGNSNNQATDMQGAVQSVADALSMGFPTFVVGIATTSDPSSDATLTAMANAGGKPRAVAPPYYPVMNQQDLVDALNAIVVIAGTCVFTIPPPPNGSTDQQHIGVQVNGTEIPKDTGHTNGWDYLGTNQVQVYGSSCNAIMAGNATVAIVFKCIIG